MTAGLTVGSVADDSVMFTFEVRSQMCRTVGLVTGVRVTTAVKTRVLQLLLPFTHSTAVQTNASVESLLKSGLSR